MRLSDVSRCLKAIAAKMRVLYIWYNCQRSTLSRHTVLWEYLAWVIHFEETKNRHGSKEGEVIQEVLQISYIVDMVLDSYSPEVVYSIPHRLLSAMALLYFHIFTG